jgi:TonB family protein
MKRRTDAVTWIYDHRAGVFSLVALALVMAILFIGSKIVVRTPVADDGIIVDLRTVEDLRREAERLRRREESLRRSEDDLALIRNAASNEGAEMRDDPAISDMNNRADLTNENMRGNRDAWDQGLREIEAMKGTREGDDGKNSSAGNDTRSKGRVMVEFLLVDPLRTSAGRLPVPGYQSENFGEVVVDITVDHNGDVVAAKVDASLSTNDSRMRETALEAARRSRFNIDRSAPDRHTGTITYTFVAQ